MLLFSAMLDIKPSVTKEDFINAIIEWNNSNFYNENIIDNVIWQEGEKHQYFGSDNLWLDILESDDGSIVAVRYEKRDGKGIIWDTDYVMNFNEKKMSVILERSYSENAQTSYQSYSRPYFIQILLDKGYIADDNGVDACNSVMTVSAENFSSSDILCVQSFSSYIFRNPSVYITRSKKGKEKINTDRLLKRVRGIAHAICEEESGFISDNLFRNEDITIKKGDVVILNSGSDPFRIYRWKDYREYEDGSSRMTDDVISDIIKFHTQKHIESVYTWNGVVNASILDRYNNAKNELKRAIENKGTSDEELDSFFEEFDQLTAKNAELSQLLEAAKFENRMYREQLSSTDNVPVLYMGSEKDYYPGETREFIVSALESYAKGLSEDITREKDIIEDVIEHNKTENERQKRTEEVKRLFRGFKDFNDIDKKALSELGITVISQDGKHMKLGYYGNERYLVIAAKTPSDSRTGDNTASKIINKMM